MSTHDSTGTLLSSVLQASRRGAEVRRQQAEERVEALRWSVEAGRVMVAAFVLPRSC